MLNWTFEIVAPMDQEHNKTLSVDMDYCETSGYIKGRVCTPETIMTLGKLIMFWECK
jgi:hypothetical protein